jgi:hypothetical protein
MHPPIFCPAKIILSANSVAELKTKMYGMNCKAFAVPSLVNRTPLHGVRSLATPWRGIASPALPRAPVECGAVHNVWCGMRTWNDGNSTLSACFLVGVAAPGRESEIRSDTRRIPDSNPEAGSFSLFLFRLWRFHVNQPELEIICRQPPDVRLTTG